MRSVGLAGTLVVLLGAGGAAAQDQPFEFPNPNRAGGVAATCDTWEAQVRAADREAMQQLAGRWQGQGTIPGTPGIMQDTPEQIVSEFTPEGTFRMDRSACFQMLSVPGMPPLPPSCAQSFSYGWWVAHFVENGALAVATMSSGSGYNGQALPMSCALGYLRAEGANTMVDRQGGRAVRIGR
jgi:hypothetical protein